MTQSMTTTFTRTRANTTTPRKDENRPLRVMHLIDTFSVGGAEVLLLEGLPHLARQGFDVRVRALTQPTTLRPIFRAHGIDADVLSHKKSLRPTELWQLYAPLRDELRANPVDIIHTHLFDASLVGRMARFAVRPAPQIVTTLHNPVYSNLPLQALKLNTRRFVDWATGFFANESFVSVSDAVASDYIKHLGSRGPWGRMNVIYNGIDVRGVGQVERDLDRAAARAKWGWKPGEIAILSVGHLKKQKNYQYLIDAMTRLRAQEIPVRAVVIGDGGEASALRALGGDLVHFVGAKTREDAWNAIAACDVYVQPSHFEGFGIAILEAMAAARPVVATNVDGIVELMENDKTGLLVPLNDVDAFTNAIRRVAYEPGLAERLGAAAKIRANANFGVENWVARTATLYRELGGQPTKALHVDTPRARTSVSSPMQGAVAP